MWSLVSSLPNPHYSISSTSSRDSRSQSRKRSATTTTTTGAPAASASVSASSESLGLHYNEPSSALSGTRKIHTSSSAAVSSLSSRPPTAPAYSTASSSTIDLGLGGLSELLEPAIDGPPSPERLRALSNQMRQASMASRSSSTSRAERTTLSRHAPTSSTSSLRSIVSSSNWPSWEPLTLDTSVSSLSRKSSSRSTISSLRHSTVKERPDSGVQAFGKAIFQGRGRLRREHSDLGIGSAASSMSPLSNDLSTFEAFASAPTSAGVTSPSSFTSESRFPSIFSRRRSAKPDDPTPTSSTTSPIRKYNISGPYNFQHLTHTNRDDLPALPATSRVELVNEFSSFNAAHRTATMPELSPELTDKPIALSTDEPQVQQPQQPKQILSSPAEIGHRRIMSGSRSSSTDQLRSGPPPRPPRPAESLFPLLCSPLVSAPMPPPRVSSRSSNQPEGIELAFDRPATANSLTLPEAMSISLAGVPSGCHFSHAITTPDDVAWPMPSPTSPPLFEKLADVPEEEEYFNRSHISIDVPEEEEYFNRSHISIVDIHEHLRENASAPTPREMAGPHPSSPGVSTRPCSAGSDTLGYLSHSTEDIAAEIASLAIASTDSLPTDDSQSTDTTIASPQLQAEVHAVDAAISGSWEDDIDYAYDHEVEADCSYEWKRTSLDIRIERQESEDYQDAVSSDISAAGYCDVTIAHLGLHHVVAGLAISSPSASSVPALSPTSPATATLATTSAVTPVSATSTTNPFAPPQPPVLSNFSLPRSAHGRSNSSNTLSTFRESQGFTLSPSLLIPADYRQQMMMLTEVDDEVDASFEDEADADALFIHDPRADFEVKFNARKNRMSSVYRPSPDRTSTSTMTTLSTVASSDISTVTTNLSAERHVSASTTMTRMTCNSDIMGDWSPVSDAGVVLGVEPTEVDFLRLGSSTGDLPATAKAMPTVPLRRRALTTSLSTPSFSIFPIPRSQPHQV